MTSITKNIKEKNPVKIISERISLSTEIVYLPPSHALALVTNSTNTSPTMNLRFVFLRKPIIILRMSDMRKPSDTESIFGGSSGYTLYVEVVDNPQKYWE